jgi:hypothetical protein
LFSTEQYVNNEYSRTLILYFRQASRSNPADAIQAYTTKRRDSGMERYFSGVTSGGFPSDGLAGRRGDWGGKDGGAACEGAGGCRAAGGGGRTGEVECSNPSCSGATSKKENKSAPGSGTGAGAATSRGGPALGARLGE